MKIHSPEFPLRSSKLAAIVAAGGLALTGCSSKEAEPLNSSKPSSAEPARTTTTITTTEATPESQPVEKEVSQTEPDPLIVELLCDLKVGYVGPAFDKKASEAFLEGVIDHIPVTEEEFRAAAGLAEYNIQPPGGGEYTIPITPDTVIPYPDTFRADFKGENC